MNRLVAKDHVASYVDPITINAGERLNLTGRRDEWDGHVWLWAVAADGREGWIPDTLPEVKDGHCVASYTYSAAELSVCAGEVIDTLRETHGWVWGANDKSEQGWYRSTYWHRASSNMRRIGPSVRQINARPDNFLCFRN